MTITMTYEGYTLYERASGGFASYFDGKCVNFDTAGQWMQYINYIKGRI